MSSSGMFSFSSSFLMFFLLSVVNLLLFLFLLLLILPFAGCVSGYYGQDCQYQCGAGCDDVCSKVDGTCSCVAGWTPPFCQGIVGFNALKLLFCTGQFASEFSV